MDCSKAIEDIIFSQMLKSFESGDFAHLEAPEGFEERVMARLEALGAFAPVPKTVAGLRENAIYFVFGACSIFLGCGLLLALNSQGLLLEHVVSFLQFLVEQASGILLTLNEVLETSFEQSLQFLSGYQFFFPAILGVLLAVQYFIYKKEKVEA